jgi:hypothetical protein
MYTFAPSARPIVESRVRRIVDLTVPNFARQAQDERFESRSNRVIPVLICPWEDGKPVPDQYLFALTKDLSSDSAGVVLPQPVRTEGVLVGFWLGEDVMEEPWYFVGRMVSQRKLGGGFWTAGIQFTEFLTSASRDAVAPLQPLAARLPAPTPAELAAASELAAVSELVGQ